MPRSAWPAYVWISQLILSIVVLQAMLVQMPRSAWLASVWIF
ncbi:hypothetical protein S7711_11400 [Stachybotrys chartarum IBT 7711]|uniref:Uncharacterized protein n=1 Tax=Stachybotrys chartarum (strain CBS 109288 / IBT 7711) TaxID=1280523 RepID=A0A084B8R9_STACB|nr:hypothetical protein S7711_11400 [Stachybotrys chartarum IBT 7711]